MNTKSLLLLILILGGVAGAEQPRYKAAFDVDWRFHLGDAAAAAKPGFVDESWRLLNLPHDYSSEGDFSPDNVSSTAFLPGGIAWYRKSFTVPAGWRKKRVSIEFDGVSMRSRVWINGRYLGQCPYAYSAFRFDLTPYLHFGASNLMAVRVDRSVVDDSRWYPGSGIYRHVWLIATEPIHIARHGVFVTTPEVSGERAKIKVRTLVQNETSSRQVVEIVTKIKAPDGGEQVAARGGLELPAHGMKAIEQTMLLASPRLWSPDSPALYQACSRVQIAGKAVDQFAASFGIRSIRFDARQGFFLNDRPLKMHGVCLHHDAGVLGAAVPAGVWARRLRLLKEMGVNAVRCAHNPMAPELYDLCDRLGLLVIDEAFDEWGGAKRKWVRGWNLGEASLRPGYSEFFPAWAERDLREMVQRGRNHPSIVLWSIGNEIDYPNDPYSHPADGRKYDPGRPDAGILARTAPGLIRVVRESDPTRPVTAGLANLKVSNATGLADLLDVVGYNYQFDQYAIDMAKYPDRKIVGSETGYGMNYFDLVEKEPRVTGQFLWAGIDYLGEALRWPMRGWGNGLLDTCGFLKPAAAFRAALWAEKPMVYACVASPAAAAGAKSWQNDFTTGTPAAHWNWQGDPRQFLPVEVYSNCPEVELFLNGSSLGMRRLPESRDRVLRWGVAFEAGELRAVGRAADGRTVECKLVTSGKEAGLELIPDRSRLEADGEDVAHVEIRALDAKGNLAALAAPECTVTVSGAGRLLGLDNGDQGDMTPLKSHRRGLRGGRALAVVQSLRHSGILTLTVSSPDLAPARLAIPVE